MGLAPAAGVLPSRGKNAIIAPMAVSFVRKSVACILAAFVFVFVVSQLKAEGPPPTPIEESKLEVPLEPWVKKVTVSSGYLTEDNCIHLEPGGKVNLVGKLCWMPKLNGATGILVIHPFTEKNPGYIEYPVTAADAGKYLRIIARGSDYKPGGLMKFKAKDQYLGSIQIDSEWVETGIQIPAGAKSILIEWHAIRWAWEMLWIDSIDIVPSL
jgi:hypothetical protein